MYQKEINKTSLKFNFTHPHISHQKNPCLTLRFVHRFINFKQQQQNPCKILAFFSVKHYWQCNSTCVIMCSCVSTLCLSVCVGSESQLLVFARWKRLLRMSASPQQSCCSCLAYTVLVRPDVCLRCVMEQQDVAVSQQVPVSHTHWASCVSRTRRPPPVFVFMKKNVCTSAHESLRSVSSHLCLKQPSPTHPLWVYVNISSSFFLLTTVISHSPRFPSFALFHSSYKLLLFSHRLLTSFLPVTSCHCLISSPFFLSPPLLFLSSFSHAPVGEYNEMATAGLCGAVRCVCLCDVTLQQLHSGSLFFNPHAHRPHCYFKIL